LDHLGEEGAMDGTTDGVVSIAVVSVVSVAAAAAVGEEFCSVNKNVGEALAIVLGLVVNKTLLAELIRLLGIKEGLAVGNGDGTTVGTFDGNLQVPSRAFVTPL
jgi:hypothetical protein